MDTRTTLLAFLWRWRFTLFPALLVAACSAPDYTPVRDWAEIASMAADYSPVAAGRTTEPDRVLPPGPSDREPVAVGSLAPESPDADGIVAMQDALSTYLTALATLASDGVLPFREDPFGELTSRAAQVSESGGTAVSGLGSLLRRASRGNAQAPELGATIVEADDLVQPLVVAIGEAIARMAPVEAQARTDLAAYYARVERASREAAIRQSVRDWAALYDREFTARAAVRSHYAMVLTQIAQGHALLKARASRMTQEQTARLIRAQAGRLQRAAAALPRRP